MTKKVGHPLWTFPIRVYSQFMMRLCMSGHPWNSWILLVILGHFASFWVILGHVKVNVWILVMPKWWYLNVAQDWYISFLKAESNFNSVLVSKTSNNIRLHFRTKDFVDLASPLSIHYLPLMVQFLSFYVYKIS